MTVNPSASDSSDRRLHMVNGQLRTCDVTDKNVLAAFLDVPREAFAAPGHASLAYVDQDIPSAGPGARKLLAPRTLARLLQAAAVEPGARALDVGGGAGYGAALLAHMGAEVVMLEAETGAGAPPDGVIRVQGDLAQGVAARAPYDVIVVHGAFEVLPAALLAQLATGGRLVGVDARGGGARRGVILEKVAGGYSERSLFDAAAETLPGLHREPSFAF